MFSFPGVRGLAGVVLFVVLAQVAPGQELKSKGPSEKTRRLLEEVARVHRDAAAYSDNGVLEIEFASVPPGAFPKPKTASTKAQLAFARPNKFALNLGTLRIICDGKEMTTVIDSCKRYFVAPAPKEITIETFRSEQMKDLLNADGGTMYLQILLTLLLSPEPVRELMPLFQHADPLACDRVVAGRKCLCLNLIRMDREELRVFFGNDPTEMRLLVDSEAKRLVGFETDSKLPRFFFSPLPSPPTDVPPELEGAVIETTTGAMVAEKMRWIAGEISSNVPPDSVFSYRAPQEYQRMESIDALFKTEPLKTELPANVQFFKAVDR